MNRTQLLNHYLNTAKMLKEQGCRRWALVYARKANRLMEGM